jgi:hypothetical protein
MIRTSIFFIKWGTILAVIIGCTGWAVGNSNSILLPFMGDTAYGAGSRFLFDLFNGMGKDTDRSQSTRSRRKPPPPGAGAKPKPWDSFERHREWQFQQQQETDRNGDALKTIGDIVGAAEKALKGSKWWEAARGIVDDVEVSAGNELHGERKDMAYAKGKSTRPR